MSGDSSINEIAAALAKAQGMMKNAVMDKTNPHFRSRYASLASVLDAIRDPLAANGLAVSQAIRRGDSEMWLETTLMHSSGQVLESFYPLPMDAKPQEMGSALTYARRYSLAALIGNHHDEDDDGNAVQNAKNVQIPAGFLTVAQQAEISGLMEEAGVIGETAGRWFAKLGATDVDTIRASKFEQVRQALIERIAKKAAENPE